VSHLLIGTYYLVSLFQMQQTGGLVPAKVFNLWVLVIVSTILVNIIGNILTHILLSIVHAIKTRSDKVEKFIEDERDNLIGLKGNKVSYIAYSIGVLIAMLTFVFGQPPLMMFSLLVLSGILAEIIGDLSQLSLYRKGF
jgi:phosphoglycerol transferase MdoB-like AlkP superfamily enzyme